MDTMKLIYIGLLVAAEFAVVGVLWRGAAKNNRKRWHQLGLMCPICCRRWGTTVNCERCWWPRKKVKELVH